MFLVSEPERRLLVRSPLENNHETTLVVPELSRARVEYFKCLVDAGPAFEEHAVVMEGEEQLVASDRALVVRGLTAARPTVVSFVSGKKTETLDGEACPAAAKAASAVVACPERAAAAQISLGFSLRPEGRFYVCELVGTSEH